MRQHSIVFQRYLTVIYFILIFTLPGSASAEKPLETVKGYADKVLDVLRDPALKGESSKKVRKEKIREISKKMFDFNELSKRTLSNHWRKLNPEQQQEFVRLYTSLLEDAYADKILSYTNEKITFSREIMLSDRIAEVQSIVQRRTAEIPIYYRVMLKDGAWRVYDVVIEGVSLINNYRSQFREILLKDTPEALLQTLRKKVGKT
ncbi:MAG: ABC transporter substrate-binding protein [Nitrospiraceae bacterium]|nr:ABC transporter substrate-binding protein [Nitrospiraceae bacterium]